MGVAVGGAKGGRGKVKTQTGQRTQLRVTAEGFSPETSFHCLLGLNETLHFSI